MPSTGDEAHERSAEEVAAFRAEMRSMLAAKRESIEKEENGSAASSPWPLPGDREFNGLLNERHGDGHLTESEFKRRWWLHVHVAHVPHDVARLEELLRG